MAYVKILYQDSPSTATPLNAQNLNHMDDQIALNDQRLTELEGAHVSSFNGRTGAVTPADGDYDIGQIAPLTGAQVGQVPVVTNIGTEEDPELVFRMGAGGHEIIDSEGNTMPQESAMQFPDSHVSDDSTNGKTIVENIKEVDPADYDSTTDEGIIVTDDGNDALIGAVSDDYVEVDITPSMTYGQALSLLFTEADLSKITEISYINMLGSVYIPTYSTSALEFTNMDGASSKVSMRVISFNGSTATYYNYNLYTQTRTNDSAETIGTNGKLTLHYGNRKATVDLQTTANRCLYDSNTTVKQKIDGIGTATLIETVNSATQTKTVNLGSYRFYLMTIEDSSTGSVLFTSFVPASLINWWYLSGSNGTTRALLQGNIFTCENMPNSDWCARLYGIN